MCVCVDELSWFFFLLFLSLRPSCFHGRELDKGKDIFAPHFFHIFPFFYFLPPPPPLLRRLLLLAMVVPHTASCLSVCLSTPCGTFFSSLFLPDARWVSKKYHIFRIFDGYLLFAQLWAALKESNSSLSPSKHFFLPRITNLPFFIWYIYA